jgi:hypothetical protein
MGAMSRRNRLFTAVLAAAMLLFAQLAVSAYACPMAAQAPEMAQAGCDEDMGSVNLCEQHCDYGSASFDAAKPLQASPVAVLPSLRIELPDPLVSSIVAPRARIAAGPAPPPPLSRFTVLRI